MTVDRVRVGEVLRPERTMVTPDPTTEYVAIGVRSFGKGIFHYEPKLGDDLGSLRFFDVVPGRLVVSNIKGWEGAISVATEADRGCVASNRFLQYVPRDERIDIRWICWFLLSEQGIELIQRASPGSADRNRTLAIDRFEALEIPLPPLDEQRHVAARLDGIRSAASELTARSRHAETLASALAVSTATRPDLEEHAKERAGWRRVPLARVLELSCDETLVDSAATYEVAGVYSFGRGMFRRASIDGTHTSYKVLHKLRRNQIVMSRLKAWEGALALVPDDLEGWFVSPEFPTFDIDLDQADPRYLGSVLSSEPFWTRLKGASKGIGARRERVSALRLLEQSVELPPLDEQRSVSRSLNRLDAIQIRTDAVAKRVDALLPAAINEVFAGLR